MEKQSTIFDFSSVLMSFWFDFSKIDWKENIVEFDIFLLKPFMRTQHKVNSLKNCIKIKKIRIDHCGNDWRNSPGGGGGGVNKFNFIKKHRWFCFRIQIIYWKWIFLLNSFSKIKFLFNSNKTHRPLKKSIDEKCNAMLTDVCLQVKNSLKKNDGLNRQKKQAFVFHFLFFVVEFLLSFDFSFQFWLIETIKLLQKLFSISKMHLSSISKIKSNSIRPKESTRKSY